VTKHEWIRAKTKGKACGGWLTGGGAGKAEQTRIEDYFAAAAADKSHEKWSKVKDVIQMIKKHESWLKGVLKEGKYVLFPYGIDEMDYSKDCLIHISGLKNVLTEAVLMEILSEYGGITSGWTYWSAVGGRFGWHKEDSDLCSLNANLKGDSKIWVSTGSEASRLVETNVARIMRKTKFEPRERALAAKAKCADMLRHKDCYFPGRFFEEIGAEYYYVEQQQGYAVLTLPGCGHQGWNTGSSMHVAVNQLPVWGIPFAMASTAVRKSRL
jgi:hypothetical protein